MKKHIVCLGDSNTHGYCADPSDCADSVARFNEDERWTCLLQKALGEGYLVTEEGLSGRTTVFPDPLHESMERLGVNASCIGIGMERLVRKAQSVDCWGAGKPNILIVCPPPILPEMESSECGLPMGRGCLEKSRELPAFYRKTAELTGAHFLDADGCEFNRLDGMHLTRRGHAQLAQRLAEAVPGLLG